MTISRSGIIAVATFLLDHRSITAGEQSFLLDMRGRARIAGPRLTLTYRQDMWIRSIVERHGQAIAEGILDSLIDVERVA